MGFYMRRSCITFKSNLLPNQIMFGSSKLIFSLVQYCEQQYSTYFEVQADKTKLEEHCEKKDKIQMKILYFTKKFC